MGMPSRPRSGGVPRARQSSFHRAASCTMGIRDRPSAPRSPWQNGHTERLIELDADWCASGSHAVLLITKYMLDAGAHLRRLTPSRDAMASMLSSRPARNMLRVAIARARPSSIAFAAPLPITRRTPFPARRRLAVIDRTKGSTEPVGLGGAQGITLDTIAVRSSHTKIWASPIWICWTKDRTSSRSPSDASLVQRSASFGDRSSTARWVAASRPSGATAPLTSAPDAKSARRRSSTSPSMSPAGMRRPLGCSERLRVISAVETKYR